MRIKALKQNKSLRFSTIRKNKFIIHKRRTNRNCTTDWTMNASPAIVIYCFLEIFILCVVHRPPYPILLISLVGLLHSWTAKQFLQKVVLKNHRNRFSFKRSCLFTLRSLETRNYQLTKVLRGKWVSWCSTWFARIMQ